MEELHLIASAFTCAKNTVFSDRRAADRNDLLSLLCTPGVGSKLGVRATASRYTNPAMTPQQYRFTGFQFDQRARGSTGRRPIQSSGRQAAGAYQSQQLREEYASAHRAIDRAVARRLQNGSSDSPDCQLM